MKSTKKYLSTGVALAIALFAAVQVSAMERRTVNPYLSPGIKKMVEDQITTRQRYLDPKYKRYSELSELQKRDIQALIEGYEEVLYGNKDYSFNEVYNIANGHLERAKRENQ